MVLDKTVLLKKIRDKTKVVDIILGLLILMTGGYLVWIKGAIANYLLIKIILVFMAIPMGIIAMRKESKVLAENKLFATVDSTVRKVVIHDIPFLLTDTVGFIRKLPHSLIECFKSTLDEVREADILLHVVDISHPAFEEHMQVVHKTLLEIGAVNIPTLLVFNKIDQFREITKQDEAMYLVGTAHQPVTLEALQQSYLTQQDYPVVFIAASQKENIDTVKTLLYQKVLKKHKRIYPNFLKNSSYQFSS
ncbi:MAG: 50S ribosome-binding GTPase [Cytophagales bacterium]|nr:50S ribosome-binding GTPase [Cytophagales bacterium]